MKPNFFVIGAQKSGTTTLAEMFRQHPQIFMSRPKEIHYFDREENLAKGLGWYESHFLEADPAHHIAVGEATPNYSAFDLHPHIPDMLHEYVPNARLIYIVRHPIERIRSQWYFVRSKEPGLAPLNEVVRSDPRFLAHSFYNKNSGAFRERYGNDRVLVVFLDDYQLDPAGELARICRFLGVDDSFGFAEADKPRNMMAAPGLFRWCIDHVPGFLAAKKRVPRSVKGWVATNVLRKLDPKPDFDAETRAWVAAQLGDDIRGFLARHGKSAAHWPLE